MLLSDALEWAFRLLLGSLAAVVGLQLLTGRINTRGLFHGDRRDGTRYFSPERIQLLMVTIAAATKYSASVMANPHASSLPDVPQDWLGLMGGSHAVYLARKAFSTNFGAAPQHDAGKKKGG